MRQMAAGAPTRRMPLQPSNPNPILTTPESVTPQASADARPARRPLRTRLHGLPIAEARPPTAISCLKCQLVGRRQLTCSKADACAELPHSYAIGPILLALWLGTAIAFIVAIHGQ